MKKMTKISAAVAALLVAGIANAATPGAYVGVGAGSSFQQTPNYFGDSSIEFVPFVDASEKRTGLGGRLFGGYNFNTYFGLEAAYATYATSTNKFSSWFGGYISGSEKNALDALSLVAKGYLPLGNSGLNAYVLGGLAEVHNKHTSNYNIMDESTLNETTTTNTLRPTYGIGMSYNLPQNLTTSVELSRIQGKGDMYTNSKATPNAEMLTINLGYNFG
mgnify:CR=1 FL=1